MSILLQISLWFMTIVSSYELTSTTCQTSNRFQMRFSQDSGHKVGPFSVNITLFHFCCKCVCLCVCDVMVLLIQYYTISLLCCFVYMHCISLNDAQLCGVLYEFKYLSIFVYVLYSYIWYYIMVKKKLRITKITFLLYIRMCGMHDFVYMVSLGRMPLKNILWAHGCHSHHITENGKYLSNNLLSISVNKMFFRNVGRDFNLDNLYFELWCY